MPTIRRPIATRSADGGYHRPNRHRPQRNPRPDLTKLPPLRNVVQPWPVGVLRLLVVLLLAGQLFVTAAIQRPDLMHPARIGTDASTYFAAGQRLNAGHSLYGALRPDDRPIPQFPEVLPAPLLSPPLIAVVWRPLALLPGGLSMDLWWFGGLVLLAGLVIAFALVDRPRQLLVLVAISMLGLPLAILAGRHYLYPGFDSPISFAALSGNVNTYIVALFVITWWASSGGRGRVAGITAALAAVLKLGPVMLLWWFITRRSWQSVRAFVVTAIALGIVGVVFAGLQANFDYLHLALGGNVQPAPFSLSEILHRLFGVAPKYARYSTIAVMVIGVVAIWALRRRPRLAFTAVILTTIFSSPVVLQGNLSLLIAIAAPWVIPDASRPTASPVTDEIAATAIEPIAPG